MKNIINLDQTCSQVSLPYCRHISKNAFYSSRNFMITDTIRITSVSTLCLLVILIFSLVRVHMHIYKKFVSSVRSELLLICDLYLFAIILEFILVTEFFNSKILIIIQLSLINSIFSVLFWTSIFSTMLDLFNSYNKVRIFTIFHFIISIISYSIFFKNPEFIFLLGLINFSFIFLFFFIQTIKLKIKKSNFWPYGNLLVGLLFLFIGTILFFIGNEIVMFICNGYIDGLFVIHTFFFLAFLMLHKFWISTTDFEVEVATF